MTASVDERLTEFFRGEVPKQFPACPGEVTTPSRSPSRRSQFAYYALAAGLLLGIALWVTPTQSTKTSSSTDPFSNATADGKDIKPRTNVEKK